MATRLDLHYSGRSDDWSTPDELFAELDAIFHFHLDACASRSNAQCRRFFTKEDVVRLVSSRTDTDWWHRYAKRGQIIYLRGRLKFGGADTSAPFPSTVVIFWSGRLGDAVRQVE